MKRRLFALLLAATPLFCQAAVLDAPLACNVSAHQFVSGLIDQNLIQPHAMRVESNSINAFWPTRDADVTAFGFRVFAIVGYEKDDPIFRTGAGEPVGKSAYGAVVIGSDSKVQAAVTAAGSPAIVRHVGPLMTAIFCPRS